MASVRSQVAALAGVGCAALAAATDPAPERWLPVEAAAGVDRAAEALAVDPGTGRIAVGGERGVAWGPLAGPLERVLSRGPVHDLVFERDGSLLAATEVGLYRIEAPDRVSEESVAIGDAARQVRGLAVSGDLVVAATSAGVFERVARDPSDWQRVAGLPFGEAQRVAITTGPHGERETWAAIDGALWSAGGEQGARRVTLPGAAEGEEGPIDLAVSIAGDLFAVLRRSLAVRSASGVWRIGRLVLPQARCRSGSGSSRAASGSRPMRGSSTPRSPRARGSAPRRRPETPRSQRLRARAMGSWSPPRRGCSAAPRCRRRRARHPRRGPRWRAHRTPIRP